MKSLFVIVIFAFVLIVSIFIAGLPFLAMIKILLF